MADFEKAIHYVLGNEGGFVNHPNDPGGSTNFGVSLRFLKASGMDINDDGTIDEKDIKALTQETVTSIYKLHFWDPHHYGAINHQDIATKVFDLGVNIGSRTANVFLQRSANYCLGQHLLKVDGVVGKKTIEAVNSCHSDTLMNMLCQEACIYYSALCAKNPDLKVFLKGWLIRANKRYGGEDV